MRDALDNMDGCGGVDNVIRQGVGLYLSDDYKEVKGHVLFVCVLFHASEFFFIKGLIHKVFTLMLFCVKGIVWHFRNYTCSCQGLDDKINTTVPLSLALSEDDKLHLPASLNLTHEHVVSRFFNPSRSVKMTGCSGICAGLFHDQKQKIHRNYKPPGSGCTKSRNSPAHYTP